MDRLPLVPQNETHDVLPLIRQVFQDALRDPKYPIHVAENYKKYRVDPDFLEVQKTGLDTVKILETVETRKKELTEVESEIMKIHKKFITQRDAVEGCKLKLDLKRVSLLQKLSKYAVATYELIQTNDLYPHVIEQYLDFTCNPALHTCNNCPLGKTDGSVTKTERVVPVKKRKPAKTVPEIRSPVFKASPEKITFHNYELGQIYKEKFKLRNITPTPQVFLYFDFPQNSPFHLKMLTDSCRLAPGMSAEFLVEYRPRAYENSTDFVKFKTSSGIYQVAVTTSRDSPHLACYVFNVVYPVEVMKPHPGSKYFSERRRSALNFTIDCGTCLYGSYQLICLVMKNEGQKGRFFVTSENEWVFSELNGGSDRCLELTQGAFTIFPAYFEADHEEVVEIFVLFVPDSLGVFTEKVYFLCDNNTHQEVELLGDCIAFMSSFLKVDMYLVENTFVYFQRTINITLGPSENSGFIFSIVNNSPIYFKYYWGFKTCQDHTIDKPMDPDWIQIIYNTPVLPPFSTTDVVVRLVPKFEKEDSYYIYLSLYLKEVPILSLKGEPFYLKKRHKHLTEEIKKGDVLETQNKLADVHVFELGIFCQLKRPVIEEITRISVQHFPEPEIILLQQLRFSKPYLAFGVVPKGVTTSKSFYIESITQNDLDWKLLEIQFGHDSTVISSAGQTLSVSRGTLKKNCKQKITYTITTTDCVRWLSILVLFAYPSCTCGQVTIESVCIITYEVVEYRISLHTDNNEGVLCPKEFLYLEVPSYHKIYVHNEGILTGCFYFLKPVGAHAENVRVRLQPQSGMVPTNGVVEVLVELVALRNGIFDDIHIRCFVGDPDKVLSLRVVCSVSSINVLFHLPNRDEGYCRVLWPPSEKTSCWDLQTGTAEGESAINLTYTLPVDESLTTLIGSDSVAGTYPTIHTKLIQVKKAVKLTFYVENLTQIGGTFAVTPTNFSPECDCLNHILVRAKTRTPEFFWEKSCLEGHGIVIEAARPSGDVVPYEVVPIELWIYANTYGKYLEEVMVEINDLTPFCFNLVVDVVGLPVEFPFARNTLLPCPTIRFENVAYSTETCTKGFTVTNTSSVPVELDWQVFGPETDDLPFNVLLQFEEDNPRFVLSKSYGYPACSHCISVEPCHFVLEKLSTATVTVTISTTGFKESREKMFLKYDVIGFIGLQNCDKFKENYFKRKTGVDSAPAKLEVSVTLEKPVLMTTLCKDETVIDVFVNDILLEDYKFPEGYILLRNVCMSPLTFAIDIEKPFRIIEARTIPSGGTNPKNLVVGHQECLQVLVTCSFTKEELLEYGELIYQHCEVDDSKKEFTSLITKHLKIAQKGKPCQKIPFQIRLHYPRIEVKPVFLKFGHSLIYTTKKKMFTIYNMTASPVRFEIFKTTKFDHFEIQPSHGEIPRSTGVNKQFVDVTVYFTPRHCKLYLESLRIYTNIHHYFFDMVLSGYGSNDEKFNMDQFFYS